MINRGISADLQITINSSRVFPPPGKAEASRLSRYIGSIRRGGVYVLAHTLDNE